MIMRALRILARLCFVVPLLALSGCQTTTETTHETPMSSIGIELGISVPRGPCCAAKDPPSPPSQEGSAPGGKALVEPLQ